jgi:hypothetical protein
MAAPTKPADVKKSLANPEPSTHGPMYGPAVRRKRIRSIWRVYGLASMYPAFDWSVELRAIMDISARAFSLCDRPLTGQMGHQGSHAPGRPILHLVSLSRRPRQVRVRRQVLALP